MCHRHLSWIASFRGWKLLADFPPDALMTFVVATLTHRCDTNSLKTQATEPHAPSCAAWPYVAAVAVVMVLDLAFAVVIR
jgi:hypothetical protein